MKIELSWARVNNLGGVRFWGHGNCHKQAGFLHLRQFCQLGQGLELTPVSFNVLKPQ